MMGNLDAFSTLILRVQISIVDHSLFALMLRYDKFKKIKRLEGLTTFSKDSIVDHSLFALMLRYDKFKKIKRLAGLTTFSKELLT